jgi:RNA polymerase sigma-70 factor (ECF subfamily)
MDDDELIARLARGDDGALRELFSRHAPWLAVRLRAMLSADDVEDVLQETFLAAWRGAAMFQARESAGGWLWVIARRQAGMWLRGRGPGEAGAQELAGLPAAQDVAQAAVARADIARARESLGRDGGPDREMWRLLFVEDRPVAQVAALLGVPAGTVKSRAFRIRRQMRRALAGRPAAQGGS